MNALTCFIFYNIILHWLNNKKELQTKCHTKRPQ